METAIKGYFQTYNNLHLIVDREYKNAYGYRYLIQGYACSAHTAFRTKKGIRRFLKDTGLKLGRRLHNLYNCLELNGEYAQNMILMENKEFIKYCKEHKFISTKIMSNGEYTKAFVEKTNTGNIIHFLNPNCKDREIINYSE